MNNMTCIPPVQVVNTDYAIERYSPRLGEVINGRKLVAVVTYKYASGTTAIHYIARCVECGETIKVSACKVDKYLSNAMCKCHYGDRRKPHVYHPENYIGKIYGVKRVIGIGRYPKGQAYAECECTQCGKITTTALYTLTHGGCHKCKACSSWSRRKS